MEARQRKKRSIGLEELPNELLVHIFSFLPTSRDIVKLRYVSRKIRSISETPSLWKKLFWPWYDEREEKSLNAALEVCGTHVNRLVVPDVVSCIGTCLQRGLQCNEWDEDENKCCLWYDIDSLEENLFFMAPSTAMKMLRCCCNVTEVTLGMCLNGDEVKEVVEKMEHLRKLEICHNISKPSKPIIAAAGCANLEKLVLHGMHDFGGTECLSEWVHFGFQPRNLSIVLNKFTKPSSLRYMLKRWSQWNSQIPAGHTAYYKLYSTECNLQDVSLAAPVFQLDFGQTATYPLVKASDFGLFGFSDDVLLLTNSTSTRKVVHKVSVKPSNPDTCGYYEFSCPSRLCCKVSSLSFVTDFTARDCELLSSHLEQLSVACPNLERLNLRGNTKCLESLQGLRNIVDHCHNLQGLNLENVHMKKRRRLGSYEALNENCMELWEVLSEIKMLNHLRIEMCTMKPFMEIDVCSQHSFVELALKFVHLKQLDLMESDDDQTTCVFFSDGSLQGYPVLLSHFPSLVCLYVETLTVTILIADIITNCKNLKYFKYRNWEPISNAQSFLIVPNTHLQYLDIESDDGVVDEVFMDSVSVHGELEIVYLSVLSITEAGITALIGNSPKLCIFNIFFYQEFEDDKLISIKDRLEKKFIHRKLFNLDGFTIRS